MSSEEVASVASTRAEAEARLERITALGNDICSFTAAMCGEVEAAYFARDWEAMGYASWEEYQDARFPRLQLPRGERRELVSSLREAGLSTRAIASATGTSDFTVREDLKSGARNHAPAGEVEIRAEASSAAPVTGLDGKTYSPSKPPVTDLISGDDVAELNGQPRADEPIDAEVVDNPPAATEGPAVTPEPVKKPKPRKPITEQARKEAFDGRKWADRIRGLMRDDRRARNAEELCTALQGDLMHVRDVVNEALETLDHIPNHS